MAGNVMSPPEQSMYETIKYLLSLPEEEQQKMEQATTFDFSMERPAPRQKPRTPVETPLCVTLNTGCIEALELLCRPLPGRQLQPAALSFAHGYNCGGGFEHAGGSQEEAIFRNSSIFLSLWPHRRTDDGPGVLARGMWIGEFDHQLPRKEAFYPHSRCGGIYSPHVRLVRKQNLPSTPSWPADAIESAPLFSVLTFAAQDVTREPPFDERLLVEKVRACLHVAALHGHDALVLGAFGCGVFRNPPEIVAQAFLALLSKEFAHTFRAIVFAIPDRSGSNLDEFAKRFPMVTREELTSRLEAPENAIPGRTSRACCTVS
eukprot:TRINITY_DN51026_c0_g1_i1.p1 TRINITY_DN51026_c0_g1~~TRINITY_DN51026_c0_g1_i1.p1  ORF type:complete len:318 (+),score=58.58 TRINITY_DN51026_c0_g1_i1:120-1073(+)